MRLASRPPHLCRSGSPDPDPFVIRRSQTTEEEKHLLTIEIAGDRPPRYDKKKRFLNDRGGNPLGCAYGIRGPPRYEKKRLPLIVGRRPVPRQCSRNPTIAGDRPPRYGKKKRFLNDRGGQAPALRLWRPSSFHRRARALGCHTRIRAGFPRHAFGQQALLTSVGQERLLLTRSVAGAPELQRRKNTS